MSEAAPHRLGILISGRGSNMTAILDAVASGRVAAQVAVVLSNRPDAAGLSVAAGRGIPTVVCDHREAADRAAHDRHVLAELRRCKVDLVCLAGYMRLLGADLIRAFPNRILNIHPALLPSFPGLNAQRQALDFGARVTGCTVHFVDEGVDTGPVLLQRAIEVRPDDTESTLSARILAEEHRLYPEAVRLVTEGRVRVEGRRVRIAQEPTA